MTETGLVRMPRAARIDNQPERRNGALQRVIRRDRIFLALALASVVAVAWGYLVLLANGMGEPSTSMAVTQLQAWTTARLLLLFIMWVVMMAAMMLPSAAPMILLFNSIARRREAERRPYAPTAVLVLGYLAVWGAYSALATLAQWALHSAALLSPTTVVTSSVLGGGLLIIAGIFQWTPLKDTCLKTCRSPLGWLTTEWREGYRGALAMGLRHGAYCVGCCWALMTLLFVAGVMNLLWVAALAAFVLVEKIGPAGEWVSRAAGVLLVGWGAWLLAGAVLG